jgi:ferrochelatase
MKAVMLMAYGTPKTLGDVQAYYTHIRGGRKPSPEELANLVERYKAIGGTSPLIRITEEERSKLQSSLAASGSETRVYSAMKHSPPFIADVVKEAVTDGIDELLSIPLAPHYSKMSTGTYALAVELANAALPTKMKLDFVLSWNRHPELIGAWAKRIRQAERTLPTGYSLVFSAHSLPERILAQGDTYRIQLLETAELIAAEVGKEGWSFAFQSASHTGEPWLGPDILEHLQQLVDKGQEDFLIAPIGFVSDHLEILYDIDIECKQWAKDHGVRLTRCESLNASDELIGCLRSLVLEKHFE